MPSVILASFYILAINLHNSLGVVLVVVGANSWEQKTTCSQLNTTVLESLPSFKLLSLSSTLRPLRLTGCACARHHCGYVTLVLYRLCTSDRKLVDTNSGT